jgi:SP family facilitated glucose transporter-like MFS transporter 8
VQVGLLATYVSGIYLEWAPLALSGLALVVPNLLFIWAIPESPAYLAARGRYAATETALRTLGRDEDPAVYFKQIQTEAEPPRSVPGGVYSVKGALAFLKTYTDPAVWRPALVCFAIMFFFQATGYNTVIAYSKLIFKESGLAIDDNLAIGVTGGVILVSCAIAIGLSKVTPRKVLLLISSLGSAAALAALGAYYYMKKTEGGGMAAFGWVPLTAMIGLIIFFMVGFGAVAWTVMAELLPAHVRGGIYPFAVAFSWVCNFAFALSFGYIQRLFGSYASFWTYTALSLAGGVFIYFMVPETKDRSAEEVAAFFARRKTKEGLKEKTEGGRGVVEISTIA